MSCGCRNCNPCNRGITPPQVRQIKGYQYVVQPGDHVSTVLEFFGVPLQRWQELVGANLHKPLGSDPEYGYRHRCFDGLDVGEQLNIPASWPGAVSGPRFQKLRRRLAFNGTVGQLPSLPSPQLGPQQAPQQTLTVDRLTTMVEALNQAGVATAVSNILGMNLPTNVTVDDAIAVAYSWWPYVKFPGQWPGAAPPPLPTPPQPIPTNLDFAFLVNLVRQAVEFLRATGITDGKSDTVQKIPWDAIPWNTIPWETIGTQVLQDLSQAMIGTPLPPYSTPPVAVPNQQPNFLVENWSENDWSELLKDIDWSNGLVEIIGDAEAVECIKKNPDRLKKLSGCKQCYDNTDQFKKILCASVPADPCDCDEPAPPDDPGKEPTQPPADDKTALMVGAGVLGVLGIAATAVLLGREK